MKSEDMKNRAGSFVSVIALAIIMIGSVYLFLTTTTALQKSWDEIYNLKASKSEYISRLADLKSAFEQVRLELESEKSNVVILKMQRDDFKRRYEETKCFTRGLKLDETLGIPMCRDEKSGAIFTLPVVADQ